MALSDLTIRQAKATGSHYTINDIDGLSLAVSGVGGVSPGTIATTRPTSKSGCLSEAIPR